LPKSCSANDFWCNRPCEQREQGETLLWDIEKLPSSCVRRKHPHPQVVYAVDFSPICNQFAAGGLDGSVVLFDADTEIEETLPVKSWWVTGLAFTSDGKRLATASDGMVTFWNPDTLDEIGTFRVNEQVRRVAFLRDAMITVATEGYVRLWQARPED